ncbi:MAG: hypothetical protein KA143_02480 [Saprospiraceae bacterium]|nr:hypothetical protein [Saprospiraceae bacterium]
MAIRENSWIIDNRDGLRPIEHELTRIATDYTDLHELELPHFNSWPFAKIRG